MKKFTLIFSSILVILVLLFSTRLYMLGQQSQKMEVRLGVLAGELTACPETPNCVSTFAKNQEHAFPVQEMLNNPIEKLRSLAHKRGMKIVVAEENYLHLTETTSLWGFVDDVEFLYDPINKVLHARSASRVGHSDLGVNRERLTTLFDQVGK